MGTLLHEHQPTASAEAIRSLTRTLGTVAPPMNGGLKHWDCGHLPLHDTPGCDEGMLAVSVPLSGQ